MKKFFANLASLPFRLWMLGLGYMCWCDKCHTIVSGGFGSIDKGVHTFQCIDCAHEDMARRKNRAHLNKAMSIDPTNNEE